MKQLNNGFLIDGKAIAAKRLEALRLKVEKSGSTPSLKVILVGGAAESQLYVRMKVRRAKEVEIDTEVIEIQETGDETQVKKLEARIRELNHDKSVHGILVQLPFPKGSPAEKGQRRILETISPVKDVDCLTSANMGLLAVGRPRYYPATVAAVLIAIQEAINKIQDTRYKIQERIQETGDWILEHDRYLLGGLKAVVVGRSEIVGKPMAIALANLGATVTAANSKTGHLPLVTRQADILVSATGVPHLIKKEMVKRGAIVIDVGINMRQDTGYKIQDTGQGTGSKIIGDVDFDNVAKVAAAISPVPGGVGPLTISSLLENTFEASTRMSNKQ